VRRNSVDKKKFQELKEIMLHAIRLTGAARDAYLKEACGGDAKLEAKVGEILASNRCTAEFVRAVDLDALQGLIGSESSVPAYPRANPAEDEATRQLSQRPTRLGRYPVLSELGRGGMGIVYLVRDPTLERQIAAKALLDPVLRDPDRQSRFRREAKILASLNHPNIATIFSLEDDHGQFFLTMEFVPGESLATLIRSRSLTLDDVLSVARQLSSALEATHSRGVIHRDLKPLNVMVDPEGRVKVLDFGLATDQPQPMGDGPDSEVSPALSGIAGTPGYMSPEQLRGEASHHRVDLWALGVILFECLAGIAPFRREGDTEMMAATLEQEPDWDLLPVETPESVRRLLSLCLAKDPGERLASAREARRTIEEEIAQRARLSAGVGASAPDDSTRTNLPAPLASFVGRSKLVAELRERVRNHRLITLSGAGGCGKTRLALELGREVLTGYADGVWWVELAPIAEPRLVVSRVLATLGLSEAAGRTPMESLCQGLAPRTMLLILDNCEHLIDACSTLVSDLLNSCPHLSLIATSRERLGVYGETVISVPPLSVPGEDPSPQEVETSSAVRLFRERAIATGSSISVAPEQLKEVAQICRRLDGIPLALELAAARVRYLRVEEIAQRLDDRFGLLIGGDRDALPHHRTLRSLIDWSHELLSEAEKVLFRRLSVFAGGWTLATAESVCAGGLVEPWTCLDLLEGLLDKSLAEMDPEGTSMTGRARYRMLETIREYASAKLSESGERAEVVARHRKVFVTEVESVRLDIDGPERNAMKSLDPEYGNIAVAMEGCLKGDGDLDAGFRLVCSLIPYWYSRGHWGEGRRFCEALLTLWNPGEVEIRRARILRTAAFFALQQGDFEQAEPLANESLAICRELGNEATAAYALEVLGTIARIRGEFARARSLYEESLELHRRVGQDSGAAMLLYRLGTVRFKQGEPEDARKFYDESLDLWRKIGDRIWIASLLVTQGMFAEKAGDYERAHRLYEESLTLQRELDSKSEIADALDHLAGVCIVRGDLTTARRYHEESLAIRREIGDKRAMTITLGGLGSVAHELGEYDEARTFYEEAQQIARETGDKSGVARSTDDLGRLSRTLGDMEGAIRLHNEALNLHSEIGDKQGMAWVLNGLGATEGELGDYENAKDRLMQGLTLLRDLGEIGDRSYVATALARLAVVAGAQAEVRQAARLRAASEELAKRIGFRLHAIDRRQLEELDTLIAANLAPDEIARESAAAKAASLEEMIRYALG
jgi:non-specific serine/threonine protein kinase